MAPGPEQTRSLGKHWLQRAAVDPKTVDRWLGGRVPHPRHRYAVAGLVVEEDEEFLWPGARRTDPSASASTELITAYAYRSELDAKLWCKWSPRIAATQGAAVISRTAR